MNCRDGEFGRRGLSPAWALLLGAALGCSSDPPSAPPRAEAPSAESIENEVVVPDGTPRELAATLQESLGEGNRDRRTSAQHA